MVRNAVAKEAVRVLAWCLMALTLLLGACAAPPLSLTAQVRQSIEQVEAVLLIPQTGIDVTVTPTEGGGGGFLGVLLAAAIDSAREASAKKTSAPIVEALRSFDFRAVMAQAVVTEQSRYPRLRARTPWRLETVDSESHRRSVFDASTDSAVLFNRVSYRLESGNLYVTSDVQIFPKAAGLARFRPKPNDGNPLDEGNAFYRKTFVSVHQNVTASGVAAALTDAANSVAAQLLADLDRDS